MRFQTAFSLCTVAVTMACAGCSPERGPRLELGNPYANVNWQTVSHYRADLHVHTLQSDGCHLPDEVVRAFHDAGFSILSITDHDLLSPNRCPTRDTATPAQMDFGAFADQPSPYPDPRPDTFPANTTWPWAAFGAPSPDELGMVGIEGAELTCRYHANSFFNDYGELPQTCDADPDKGESHPYRNERLREVGRRGGLAVVNHPFTGKWPLDWYTQLYREHPSDYLVGLELSADAPEDVDYSVALWDQLLGEFMPSRPIWGFGTSDMHLLVRTRFSFTVFLLNELTAQSVKQAMRDGQFYSVVGTTTVNLTRDRGAGYEGRTAYDGTYPELRYIAVDRKAGRISIDAVGYDDIVWISSGETVQRGPIFNYAGGDATPPYVRAEIVRNSAAGPIRVLLNPFALARR